MKRAHLKWLASALLALGAPSACGEVTIAPNDGGAEPSDSGVEEAGRESDATNDLPTTDARPSDARPDVSMPKADAGTDAHDDASTDAATDASIEASIDAGPPPLVFSVMGDVPYTAADEPILQAQIVAHNASSPSKFMVHVGDIKSGAAPCIQPTYQTVAGYLHALSVPTFIIPGDNEWNDCTDPTEAWGFWTTSFGRFETYWPAAPTVARQSARDENFAWVDSGVLLVGINLVGGRVQDPAEWATRLADNATWITNQLALHGASAYAMVLFAHAEPTANHADFMTPYRAAVAAWGKPVLHVMGDGHAWKLDRPWPEQNILRVEVEQGGRAQPIQVTVSTTASTFAINRTPY